METKVYNQEGREVETMTLPKEIFDIQFNPSLIHQVVVCQSSNRRQVLAHTKNRGEVSGGGRKPWRQKGTGRARAGSIRSPLWRHGGVVFGPTKERNFKKKVPQKMKRIALLMVLAQKTRDNELIVLDKLEILKPKTKEILKVIKDLKSNINCFKDKSALFVLPKDDKNIVLAARNVPGIASMRAVDINALDLLSFKYLIFPKENIRVIKETFFA